MAGREWLRRSEVKAAVHRGTMAKDLTTRKPNAPSRKRKRGEVSLGDHIASTLAVRILAGDYPPGRLLPSEEKLRQEFKASRTALREAMHVLAAKALVEPRQRVGTIVLSAEEWNRLDPDVLTWMREVAPALGFILGRLEGLAAVQPDPA